MLTTYEISDFVDSLKEELDDKLVEIVIRLNRPGQLEELLELLQMEYLLENDYAYEPYRKTGKIVVIGKSDVREEQLLAVAKELGLDKDRFVLHLDYEEGKTFDFRKTQWNPSYCLIMVGPMAHSGKAKGDYSSVIAAIENTDGYPPVVRMGTNGLKITKTGFRETLMEMICERKIA